MCGRTGAAAVGEVLNFPLLYAGPACPPAAAAVAAGVSISVLRVITCLLQ